MTGRQAKAKMPSGDSRRVFRKTRDRGASCLVQKRQDLAASPTAARVINCAKSVNETAPDKPDKRCVGLYVLLRPPEVQGDRPTPADDVSGAEIGSCNGFEDRLLFLQAGK